MLLNVTRHLRVKLRHDLRKNFNERYFFFEFYQCLNSFQSDKARAYYSNMPAFSQLLLNRDGTGNAPQGKYIFKLKGIIYRQYRLCAGGEYQSVIGCKKGLARG